ncbi:hypothetical protein RJ639_027223 [Escallonia herrerae]|uniref:Uncharacterized protein n=1 Tax=Escallonia herrerae TaxID=1293975 RepID=A0AA89BK86_9ASTE|nr:hypothetical protein RJ639_027223 [Escallonia herrerae]
MDSWRRQRRQGGDSYSQEGARGRSHNRKPPLGSWQPTVPLWEKKFCTSVGSVPWRRIVEIKRFMHLYENVAKWNDSAGEEAFHNAKKRFYAKINGLSCDITLPDPDMYIDEIDWDSKTDPELLLDLESESVPQNTEEKDESVVLFGNSLLLDKGFSGPGWGDNEEELKRVTNSSSENNGCSWDRYCQTNGAVKANGWGDIGYSSGGWNENNAAMGNVGWGDGWNTSSDWNQNENNNYGSNSYSGWNQYENNNYGANGDGWNNNVPGWDRYEINNHGAKQDGWNNNFVGLNSDEYNHCGSGDARQRINDGDWGTWYVNDGNREGTGRYMSRYKTSRFGGDDYQRNYSGSRSGNGRKRVSFVSQQPMTDNVPTSRQWNMMNSCAPVTHHPSGKPQGWGWDKPVS